MGFKNALLVNDVRHSIHLQFRLNDYHRYLWGLFIGKLLELAEQTVVSIQF